MTTLNDVLDRMEDLATTPPNKTLTLQVIGRPGVGKTVFAVGLARYIVPAPKKVLYIDTREGWVSLDNHPGFKERVTRIQMKTFEDFGLLVQGIASGKIADVGAVILDEATTAADMLLNELQHDALGLPAHVVITEKPDWTLYRTVGDSLVQVITAFQGLKVHFILIAHERTKDDTTNGRSITRPGYSDTINEKTQRLLHVSARMTSQIVPGPGGEKYERVIQSHPSVLVDAKSRIGGLPTRTSPGGFSKVIKDWVADKTLDFAPEVTVLANDPVPAEAAPTTSSDGDDEPTRAED